MLAPLPCFLTHQAIPYWSAMLLPPKLLVTLHAHPKPLCWLPTKPSRLQLRFARGTPWKPAKTWLSSFGLRCCRSDATMQPCQPPDQACTCVASRWQAFWCTYCSSVGLYRTHMADITTVLTTSKHVLVRQQHAAGYWTAADADVVPSDACSVCGCSAMSNS